MGAAVFAGMLVGGLVLGFLSDRKGRRFCLLVSVGLNALAGSCCPLAPNSTSLIVARIVAGCVDRKGRLRVGVWVRTGCVVCVVCAVTSFPTGVY